jgi:hypothetical protein
MAYFSDEHLFPVWREPRSFWEKTGLTKRQQRALDVALVALLITFSAGWIFSAITAIRRGEAPVIARQIAGAGSPLSPESAPTATFAMNALMERFIDWDDYKGVSGELQIAIRQPGDSLALPDSLPTGTEVTYLPSTQTIDDTASAVAAAGTSSPDRPGIWRVFVGLQGVMREVPELSVVTLVPSANLSGGRIGSYRIGRWPKGEGAYAPPSGFVEVTPENMDTHVSTHFQLKDFLTKGQEGVWPKYVAISPRMLDKAELTLAELGNMGHPVDNVFVISGFRTPLYNETGGNTQGRGALSRHMYGDAADIVVDNNRDGCLDDLTADGKADIADVRVMAQAAERVEQKYPSLIGGIGIYKPVPGSHCGFIHVDTRGHRARW